ncbi:MAG: hypothetical protein QJR14_06495 [Bacillota bacterium]|nr:hypothetical protein [Bacillota bacterium]
MQRTEQEQLLEEARELARRLSAGELQVLEEVAAEQDAGRWWRPTSSVWRSAAAWRLAVDGLLRRVLGNLDPTSAAWRLNAAGWRVLAAAREMGRTGGGEQGCR